MIKNTAFGAALALVITGSFLTPAAAQRLGMGDGLAPVSLDTM